MRLIALLSLMCSITAGETRPCAHRGDNQHAPENTLPAIRAAVERHAPQIEFDVKLTRDARLVIMHDATVDRTTNGKGRVNDLNFAELRTLEAGARFGERFTGTRIPALDEVVGAIPHGTLMNVHLDASSPAVALAAARAIQAAGRMDDAIFAATEMQAAQLRAEYPSVRICNMSRQDGDVAKYVESTIAMKAQFIQIRDVDGKIPVNLAEIVRKLHANGVNVNYFGASDEAKIRALAAAGVDYILTDKLELAQQVLQSR
jgi:glycerophosphoryl diester phosphodiesterase